MSIRRVTLAAVAAVLLAAAGYGAYWFHVAGQLRKGIESWAEARRATGWEVAWADLSVAGFPGRLQARVTAPALRSPSGLSWRTDEVAAAASPFDLTRVEIHAPGTHHLSAPGVGEVMLGAQQARALLNLDRAGGLEDASLMLTGVAAEGPGMAAVTVGTLAATLDPLPVAAPTHQDATLAFSLAVQDLRLPDLPGLVMDRTLSLAEASGRVLGAIPAGAPLQALMKWSGDGGTLELDHLALDWAPLALEGDGTVAMDEHLQPMAALSTRVRGYGELMDRLARAHAVEPGVASAAKMLLGLLAKPDSRGRPAIPVPLTVQDGGLWLGPARVADVPPIPW